MSVAVRNITCLCLRCMDFRLDSRQMHGHGISYVVANAGASMPVSPSNHSINLGYQVASFFLLYSQAKEDNKLVITAPSGHFDCLHVRKIWDAATGKDQMTERFQQTLYMPYLDLARHVQSRGLSEEHSLRLLSAAKTLFDVNNFFTYPEVRKAMGAGTLKFVAYYEDPTQNPHRLMIYDPKVKRFTEPKPAKFNVLTLRYGHAGPRLMDVRGNKQLLDYYEVRDAIDVHSFVNLEAERLRKGTSVLLPVVQQPSALRRKVRVVIEGQRMQYVMNAVASVARRTVQNILPHRLG